MGSQWCIHFVNTLSSHFKIFVMKHLLLISLIGISSFTSVYAQNMSKSEKKVIKKELKTYKKNPTSYVKMKKDQQTAIAERDQTIEELTLQLDKQNAQLLALRETINELNQRMKDISSTQVPEGTVYAVQIGYFQLLKLQEFNAKVRTIRAENQSGGKRYVIGYFDDINLAKKFNDEIKTIGIEDAFVTQYIDGKRNMTFDANK